MVLSIALSRFVVLACGTVYPAYRSYKAIRTKNVREYMKWLMYWTVFAIFMALEGIIDYFVSFWFPFYYETKILFVLWLLTPWTKGASILYRKWVHPTLLSHEDDIDAFLDQMKSESYNQVVRVGSQVLFSAREVVAQAAIRGQAQLVQRMSQSASLQDIKEDEPTQRKRVSSVQSLSKEGAHVTTINLDEDHGAIKDNDRAEETLID